MDFKFMLIYSFISGYWLFHCHFLYHLVSGMSLVIQVGEVQDLPPVPEGFPKCGSYLPAI